jgi:hypothetical protein
MTFESGHQFSRFRSLDFDELLESSNRKHDYSWHGMAIMNLILQESLAEMIENFVARDSMVMMVHSDPTRSNTHTRLSPSNSGDLKVGGLFSALSRRGFRRRTTHPNVALDRNVRDGDCVCASKLVFSLSLSSACPRIDIHQLVSFKEAAASCCGFN